MFDPNALRHQFPLLHNKGQTYVYLDNSATTHKPQQVIEAELQFYSQTNANIHRANHQLARQATEDFEAVRCHTAQFIHAQDSAEIIWTRGTTESINLVAHSYARTFLKSGDEILISQMEHHANIVPWQLAAIATGAVIKVIPLKPDGTIDIAIYRTLFTAKTRLVCVCHVSNALGTINPIKQMIEIAHAHQVISFIDGAQAIAHIPIDVQALGCDFYAFSAHKMYGPTGVGVLYGKRALLEKMPPYQAGGEMIRQVSFTQTTFNDLPFKFEAGTPNIAGVIGLGAAIKFIQSVDRSALYRYETQLLDNLHTGLTAIPGCRVLSPRERCALISFVIADIHSHDLATLLDEMGVAVRSGTHCAMPIFQAWSLEGATRLSVACYTTQAEIDQFFQALHNALALL